MCKLSKADIVKFHELMGRTVPPELYTPDIVTLMLTEARRDAKVAEEFERHVWSRIDPQEYLDSQAHECAEFAVGLLAAPVPRDRTFMFKTVESVQDMGELEFGKALPVFVDFAPWLKVETTIYLRSITLHPSLRRKGFLTKFKKELMSRGITGLVLEAVQNPSLAYALHRKSQQSDSVVHLGNPLYVDYERMLFTSQTYALRLC
ncbi:hypothetical protein H0484_11115 [Pusillimonas sp. CC-YST705]|uniref:N-acetyltransferase domain-containing protein n=1 Tax=Mesopusillimonas faecipullorum TaxID=2755040 RepID=A0ABS8CE51_9BURK|nr:hypothetical protein [Mesopusillimonas faecipullorum]MCB5364298.1 hypothetical protein [Mesopusillimonas faecipullorum]